MQSLLGAAPAIFLRQAEEDQGQIDLVLNGFGVGADAALNFSAMYANVKASGEREILTHMSPRTDLASNVKVFTVAPKPGGARTSMGGCSILAVDTIRDKSAGIGRDFTLPALQLGETWIPTGVAERLGVGKGDSIDVEFSAYDILSRYVSNTADLTELYTLINGAVVVTTGKDGNTTKSFKNKCQVYTDPQGSTPRYVFHNTIC